jgi:hypothetical protein
MLYGEREGTDIVLLTAVSSIADGRQQYSEHWYSRKTTLHSKHLTISRILPW